MPVCARVRACEGIMVSVPSGQAKACAIEAQRTLALPTVRRGCPVCRARVARDRARRERPSMHALARRALDLPREPSHAGLAFPGQQRTRGQPRRCARQGAGGRASAQPKAVCCGTGRRGRDTADDGGALWQRDSAEGGCGAPQTRMEPARLRGRFRESPGERDGEDGRGHMPARRATPAGARRRLAAADAVRGRRRAAACTPWVHCTWGSDALATVGAAPGSIGCARALAKPAVGTVRNVRCSH
jgi:hypothetical protein